MKKKTRVIEETVYGAPYQKPRIIVEDCATILRNKSCKGRERASEAPLMCILIENKPHCSRICRIFEILIPAP